MNCFSNPSLTDIDAFIANETVSAQIEQTVGNIVNDIRKNGDKALFSYTEKFDGAKINAQTIKIDQDAMQQAVNKIDPALLEALEHAKNNIIQYHECQLRPDWEMDVGDESFIEERSIPLGCAGIYIPGGTAPLLSSVLMTVLPAKVAGVSKTYVVTPPQKDGSVHEGILAACALCGVDAVYTVGGAQAIAALAFGTESIPKVDIIAGPGNAYVTEAKRQVYGRVSIDMIAGPSEVLVLADESANPDYVAVDLLSQIEHGKDSKGICISTNQSFLDKLKDTLAAQLKTLSRQDILKISMDDGIALIHAETEDRMIELANYIGPEHLEIMIDNPRHIIDSIKNAGVIFVGQWTPEAVGDYIAGPSHVLPTGGKARSFYGLSVYHFVKKISVINYSEQKLKNVAGHISLIAQEEGLDAHARSVTIRCKQ